jgi:TfoX/Sxy family transcriptional regulator of competence genes
MTEFPSQAVNSLGVQPVGERIFIGVNGISSLYRISNMEFLKAPARLIEAFGATAPGPPAAQRKVFGYPTAFINGNMFFGIFGESMFLRLPKELQEKMIESGGRPFEPMPGRPMREYIALPDSVVGNRSELKGWIAKSLAYARELPIKAASKRPRRRSR